ncbi:hypothetical protein BR93DRAFT_887990, partial [Coniochaeta sp. PMI_546]
NDISVDYIGLLLPYVRSGIIYRYVIVIVNKFIKIRYFFLIPDLTVSTLLITFVSGIY